MKIQLFSDVHLETKELTAFTRNHIDKEAEVIIVPGDFHHLDKAVEVLKSIIYDHQQVIYVPGNHEYYLSTKSLLKVKSDGPIHLLDNKIKVIDNIMFIGSTLWTDFLLFGEYKRVESVLYSQMFLNDYRYIKFTEDKKWTPQLAEAEFYNSLQFIEKQLKKKNNYKKVVVTHHAPSIISSNDKYKFDVITASFASNLEDFITKYKPDYWFHGHVHNSVMYNIDKTIVAVNSFGYSFENTGYIPKFVLGI